MPSPFAEVLDSLRGTFESLDLDWYVFGAQAALVHGAVRMTADVDVTVFPGDLTTEALVQALEAHGFELRDVETDFVRETRVLPLVHLETGINADVVMGGTGIEEVLACPRLISSFSTLDGSGGWLVWWTNRALESPDRRWETVSQRGPPP